MKDVSEKQTDAQDVYVLFTGAENEETGESWCPDCVTADPVLEKAVNEFQEREILVVKCPVIRSEYKNNSAYAYRRHKGIRLRCVPTFGRWVNHRLELKLEEAQCQDANVVQETLREEL